MRVFLGVFLCEAWLAMQTPGKSKETVATKSLTWSAAVALGRKGGLARGAGLRAGTIALSGAAVPIPTACIRCGEVQPSARAAWVHCRIPRGEK